ncbi:MAG TPA: FTR1 family protein [Gemmatimonadales bacterium]|nr:FTR1 family protein [Gemmatimonadales bacterium]
MALIGGPTLLLAAALAGTAPQQAPDTGGVAPAVRRIASTAFLAAQEYGVGVEGGRVTAPAEVEEARLFLTEAKRSAAVLPPEEQHRVAAGLDSLLGLVNATAEPDTLASRVRAFTTALGKRLGVTLEELPAEPPSLARGAEVYRANCASCHGQTGRGDGPLARGLDPPPADLADAAALRDVSPLDFYRRVSIGVVGTSMPAFESRLTAEERWAAAAYATLLRLPRPAGDVPAALRAYPATAKMSDAEVERALAAAGVRDTSAARVAAVRAVQTDTDQATVARTFARVRRQLDSAYGLAAAGEGPAAATQALDAYMTFEQVERSVRAKNPGLAASLEESFAALRTRAGAATPAELAGIRGRLAAGLENAERTLGETLSPLNLFVQSFIILVREGLEAILVLGALMAFLTKTGAAERKRDIHVGVGAAVGASLLTALALETVFRLSPAKREALEGATMLVATGVLFYVSYWLLSKMEVAKWNRFVKGKVQDALTSGSALALASAAFLAVYREGFETVLFYKALFVAGGAGASTLAIVAGIALGSVVMVAVYVAINRFGVRLPLKPFFAVTSAFLYYMAFVFAGRGVAELQEGGLIPTTVVSWGPRVPALGVYPTIESLAAQGVLALLALAALVWIFLIEPQRLRVTRVLVPEPAPPAAARAPARALAPSPEAPQGALLELQRSLERMEADLAEMRSEVERMRAYLATLRSGSRSRSR